MTRETSKNRIHRILAKFKKKIAQNFKQVGLVFLAFLLMISISALYVSLLVRKQMHTICEETMNTVQTTIESSLTESKLFFSYIASRTQSMLLENKTNSDIYSYFGDLQDEYTTENSAFPEFMVVYGYINEEYLVTTWTPPDTFIPTSRPWYIGAKDIDSVFCSDPYVDAETSSTCISYSIRLNDLNGDFIGVVAMDIALTRITNFLKQQKISGNGYGVLLGDDLTLFQHPNEQFIGKKLANLGKGFADVAISLNSKNDSSTLSVAYSDENDIKKLGFFRQVSDFDGWYIGVITLYSDYYSPIYVLIAVLTSVGSALMILLSFLIIRTNLQKEEAHEESMRKSSFLAKMSHEMRTPMNAIIGMTTLGREATSFERKNYCLDKISQASIHLLGVINDVLDMSKIEANKLTMSESCFTLSSLIEQVTTVVSFKIEEKQQTFTVNISPNTPKAIISDRQRLAQVITNLLSNANKFTPSDGLISLTVNKTNEPTAMLLFEIKDNGIGISKENQAKLFSSFSQADDSISRRFGGTGLGLAISKWIIEALGGTIWLESEESKGSIFKFKIPIKECTANDVECNCETEQKATAGSLEGKHLLIAEDVEINREIVSALLEDSGVIIDFAEDGAIAVQMFASSPEKYDVILMDIQMPNMDGLTASEKIRSMHGRGATIPIIAMTANAFKEDVDACINAGMTAHIGKPIDYDDMINKLNQFIPNSQR